MQAAAQRQCLQLRCAARCTAILTCTAGYPLAMRRSTAPALWLWLQVAMHDATTLCATADPHQPLAPPTGLSVHKAFSSNMVLQAEAPTVFGRGVPGSTVSVTVDSNDKTSATVV
jgi:hypothetical protein